jgi:hypothetical protein
VRPEEGLAPTESLKGLVLRSRLKPGPIVVWVEGMSDPPAFRGNPDSSIVDQVSIIRRSEFNYQQVLTIGPKFGTADDRAAIAADFTKALEQLITQGRINAMESLRPTSRRCWMMLRGVPSLPRRLNQSCSAQLA